MTNTAQPRWLLSFADLSLLLLAFFVMLHARQSDADRIVQSVGSALGPQSLHPHVSGFAAETLFEPGEAMLRPDGRVQLGGLIKNWQAGRNVIITSAGRAGGGTRFDAWELAAARTAAVAGFLAQSGIPAAAIDIDMEPASAPGRKQGQRIMIRFRNL